MTAQELELELARLQKENATLRTARGRAFSLKVSAKGAVSAYGLGRWPVTLYDSQWQTLLANAPAIQEFLVKHASELSRRGVEEE